MDPGQNNSGGPAYRMTLTERPAAAWGLTLVPFPYKWFDSTMFRLTGVTRLSASATAWFSELLPQRIKANWRRSFQLTNRQSIEATKQACATCNLDACTIHKLSQTSLDESLFAASNRSILPHNKLHKNNGILPGVSVDDSVRFRLPSGTGCAKTGWSRVPCLG